RGAIQISTWIDRACLDEAQRVVPFVFGVERSLAPWTDADAAAGDAVHILLRDTAECLRTCEDCVEIIDREIQRLCRRVRLSNRGDIYHLQSHWTTSEVTARARLFATFDPEQLAIEGSRLVEVPYLDVDPKQVRNIRALALLRLR